MFVATDGDRLGASLRELWLGECVLATGSVGGC